MNKQKKFFLQTKSFGYRFLSHFLPEEKKIKFRILSEILDRQISRPRPKGYNELCAAVASKKYKRNVFLLMDNIRNKDAELVDNYSLFEYLQSKPEYQDTSYYLMNIASPQLNEIKEKYSEHIIEYKHGEFSQEFIDVLYRTKFWLDSFQVINYMGISDVVFKSDIITVYTQHGINFFKPGYLGAKDISNSVFKKIIFSNSSERELFKKYYSYHDKDTILAGLSRYDSMKEHPEKIILLYFTTRDYFSILKDKEHSDYVVNIEKLICSNKLQEIYVAVHHTISNCIYLKSDFIHFLEDKDIGHIKNSASMLVTDCSSMCFDFLYKNRPVIFYHIDAFSKDVFLRKNSESNNMFVESKNKELFNIFYDSENVIEKIRSYAENNFTLESEYKKISDRFFCCRSDIRKTIIQKLITEHTVVFNQEGYKEGNDYFPELTLPYTGVFTEETPFCVSGLSNREMHARHTDGKHVYFNFRVPTTQHIRLTLAFRPVFTRTFIELCANGKKLDQWYLTSRDETSLAVDINKALFQDGKLTISLFLPGAAPIGHDRRELALYLRKLTLETCFTCTPTSHPKAKKTDNSISASTFYRAFRYRLLSHVMPGKRRSAYKKKSALFKVKFAQGAKETIYIFGINLLSKLTLKDWNCYYIVHIPCLTKHFSADKFTFSLFGIEIYKKKLIAALPPARSSPPIIKKIKLTDLSNKEKEVYRLLTRINKFKMDN